MVQLNEKAALRAIGAIVGAFALTIFTPALAQTDPVCFAFEEGSALWKDCVDAGRAFQYELNAAQSADSAFNREMRDAQSADSAFNREMRDAQSSVVSRESASKVSQRDQLMLEARRDSQRAWMVEGGLITAQAGVEVVVGTIAKVISPEFAPVYYLSKSVTDYAIGVRTPSEAATDATLSIGGHALGLGNPFAVDKYWLEYSKWWKARP